MATRMLLAAGVFSLGLIFSPGLIAAPESARAESTSAVATEPRSTLTVFGRTICLPAAPPDTACDLRIPPAAPAPEDVSAAAPDRGTSFALFGKRWCVGDRVEGPCDLRLPAAPSPTRPRPEPLRIFGKTLCFGELASAPECDLTIPSPGAAGDRRRASL